MKKYSTLLSLILFSFQLFTFISCTKAETEVDPLSVKSVNSSDIRELLTLHSWQIDEVKDPFSGVRFKRGVVSDGKEFAQALYTYRKDGVLTGIDWFGNALKNTTYEVLRESKKIKVTSPDCILLLEVLFISSKRFTYKSNDGSEFTLLPVKDVKN